MTTKTHFEMLRKRMKKVYENASKKLQKRMDLKIEDNQILPLDISQLPYYVMYNVHPWGDQIRLPLTKQLWTDVHMQFRRLSLTNSAQNLYWFNLYSISVCMIRNQFDYLAECECLQTRCASAHCALPIFVTSLVFTVTSKFIIFMYKP